MITVIDNYYPQSNLYEGMNLSDALDNMVIGVHEACNDFMFDCLLTEHNYLYENATEIQYVNEDGEETVEGKSLKEKVLSHIENVKNMILSAITRFIDFISEKVDDIRKKIKTIGINEKTISSTLKYIESHSDVEINFKIDGWSSTAVYNKIRDAKKYFTNKENIDSNEFKKKGDVYNEIKDLVDKISREVPVNSKYTTAYEESAKIVLTDSLNKEIRKFYNECKNSLDSWKKRILKNPEEGAIGQQVGKINDALKNNSNVVSDILKAYNTYFRAHVNIVSTCIKIANKGYAKDAMNRTAKAAKEAPGKAAKAAKEAPGKAAKTVSQAVNDTKRNVKDAVHNAAYNTWKKTF